MYSELKYSKKLSKRLQRDSEFYDILYKAGNKNNFEIEPGLREVKCLKEIESMLSEVSISNTIDLYERAELGFKEKHIMKSERRMKKNE